MSGHAPVTSPGSSPRHPGSPGETSARTFPRFFRWLRCRCRELVGTRNGESEAGRACAGETRAPLERDGSFEALNISKGVALASRVEWAGTSASRRHGLLGREHIDRDEGAYIVPTQWIHMFGMRFPIDVAFLDSKGRVLHMCHALEPNRLSPIVWRAEGALELAAGTLMATGTEVGDIIELR